METTLNVTRYKPPKLEMNCFSAFQIIPKAKTSIHASIKDINKNYGLLKKKKPERTLPARKSTSEIKYEIKENKQNEMSTIKTDQTRIPQINIQEDELKKQLIEELPSSKEFE
jgi:hypothetical protein